LADTALREAQEEVGIVPAEVELIGRLDDVYTMATQYVVTPFVGVLRPARVSSLEPGGGRRPVHALSGRSGEPAHRGTQPRTWGDEVFHVDVIKAGAHNIWGLTL
jgi:8-oxo-dGTP pyrophosphatase MutT (NUDIX family)